MNDDEVFDAVKQTLSDVQMDRPIEAIEQRGRARRRNRRLFGVVAGGGLAAAAALALALPMASNQLGDSTTTGGTTAMKPAGFTVVTQPDGSVNLTLEPKHVLNPDALQKELAAAGIPAAVKVGELCRPRGEELPQADQVLKVKYVTDSGGRTDLVIVPSKMPENSRIYFSVFAVTPGDGLAKAAQFLVSNDDPMNCTPIP